MASHHGAGIETGAVTVLDLFRRLVPEHSAVQQECTARSSMKAGSQAEAKYYAAVMEDVLQSVEETLVAEGVAGSPEQPLSDKQSRSLTVRLPKLVRRYMEEVRKQMGYHLNRLLAATEVDARWGDSGPGNGAPRSGHDAPQDRPSGASHPEAQLLLAGYLSAFHLVHHATLTQHSPRPSDDGDCTGGVGDTRDDSLSFPSVTESELNEMCDLLTSSIIELAWVKARVGLIVCRTKCGPVIKVGRENACPLEPLRGVVEGYVRDSALLFLPVGCWHLLLGGATAPAPPSATEPLAVFSWEELFAATWRADGAAAAALGGGCNMGVGLAELVTDAQHTRLLDGFSTVIDGLMRQKDHMGELSHACSSNPVTQLFIQACLEATDAMRGYVASAATGENQLLPRQGKQPACPGSCVGERTAASEAAVVAAVERVTSNGNGAAPAPRVGGSTADAAGAPPRIMEQLFPGLPALEYNTPLTMGKERWLFFRTPEPLVRARDGHPVRLTRDEIKDLLWLFYTVYNPAQSEVAVDYVLDTLDDLWDYEALFDDLEYKYCWKSTELDRLASLLTAEQLESGYTRYPICDGPAAVGTTTPAGLSPLPPPPGEPEVAPGVGMETTTVPLHPHSMVETVLSTAAGVDDLQSGAPGALAVPTGPVTAVVALHEAPPPSAAPEASGASHKGGSGGCAVM